MFVNWIGVVVVFKGLGMFIVVLGILLVINLIGNGGLVMGGMGDVLIGMIGVLFV